jgi:hypothetical protein
MNRIFLRSIIGVSALFGVSASALLAQQPNGGWRRFDDAGPAGSAQAAPAPPQGQYAPAPSYAPYAPAPAPAQITVPAGTWMTIRVNEPLSSDHNRQGDAFTATLVQPLVAQGFVVARRGQTLGGRVSEALKAGRVKGTSQLSIELTDLTLVDGQHTPLKTELVQYSGGSSVGRDVAAVGTTTGVGAAIGAAADGGFGAGVGAGAGAAASLIGVLVTRGKPTVILPEETLTFRTAAPMTISTDSAPQAFVPAQQQDYDARPNLVRRGPIAGGPGYYGPYPYPYYGPYYGPGFYGPSVVIYGRGRRW